MDNIFNRNRNLSNFKTETEIIALAQWNSPVIKMGLSLDRTWKFSKTSLRDWPWHTIL